MAELEITEKQILDQMTARYASVVEDLKSISNEDSDEAVSEAEEFLSCENGQESYVDFADISQKFGFKVVNLDQSVDEENDDKFDTCGAVD